MWRCLRRSHSLLSRNPRHRRRLLALPLLRQLSRPSIPGPVGRLGASRRPGRQAGGRASRCVWRWRGPSCCHVGVAEGQSGKVLCGRGRSYAGQVVYRNRVKGNGGLRFAHALGCLLKSDEGEGSDFARLQGQAVINHLNRMKMNGGPPFFYTR